MKAIAGVALAIGLCATSNAVTLTYSGAASEKLDGSIIDRIIGMTEIILLEGKSRRRNK